ncbi:hypothetical protein, partial [uncultured Sphingorhabdus sp.]|uniref:hypothetical protein n=1 Tax=uncultured Sphingorhabdus sp. TaxID=1686106 RepID=UPI00262A63ED
ATDADLLVGSFGCRARRARIPIAEHNMIVDEIANRFDPIPPWSCLAEQFPRAIEQFLGLAETAGQQEYQSVVREPLDRNLSGFWCRSVCLSAISDNRVAVDANSTGWGHQPGAPIAKGVAITGDAR